MSNITSIDKNFKIETKIDKTDIIFHNVRSSPFGIHGVFYEEGRFRRMPTEIARAVSSGVYSLHTNTAGGRIRFRTDSPYIAINAVMENIGKMSHFALCGSAGFDLYVDGEYFGSFIPPFEITNGFESIQQIDTGTTKMREIIIGMPLYSDVCELYIGLSEKAEILAPTPYRVEKPVVFYGSSITQGGCASRPGTCYQGFISRQLDLDYINLGFSGNARAEDQMAEYISSLDMSAFVYDYDHNAPDADHLRRTHEKMFLKIRESHPTLPIIIMSMPKPYLTPTQLERLEIIKSTYNSAMARGDDNVYFIDGRELLALSGADGTVDFTHPTDLGFFSMAQPLLKVLADIIEKH